MDKPYGSSTYIPTGILIIKIGESYKAKEWSDGTVKLENQLAKIVAKIELEAKEELAWREECRLHHIKMEEERKNKKGIPEEREFELQRTKELFNNAIYYNKAKIVREYLNELETKALDNQLTIELQDWLKWAKDKTDWFDPMIKKEDILLYESDKEDLIQIKKKENNFYRY